MVIPVLQYEEGSAAVEDGDEVVGEGRHDGVGTGNDLQCSGTYSVAL